MPIRLKPPKPKSRWGFVRCLFRDHEWYRPTLPMAGPAPFKCCRHCGARAKFVPTIDGVVGQHLPPE